MQTVRLYLLVVVGVLSVAACGQNRSNSGMSPAAAPDTAPTTAAASARTDTAQSSQTKGLRVLVLGNSIAAGRGVSPEKAFPARLQEKVDSLGWNVRIQNAGVSGETTAGGIRRIGWLLNEEVDVLLLELGGNDGLRGLDLSTTEENLRGIIDTTLATYPKARVLLAGMRIPPNLGPEYTEQFRQIYPTVAEQYAQVTLLPFILDNVAGVDSLMQNDGIHPTAAGHRLVAQNVWETLQPMLEELRATEPT